MRVIVECLVNVEVEVNLTEDIEDVAKELFAESIGPLTLRSVEVGDWSVTL